MTALAWQVIRLRGRYGDVRPWVVLATSEARDGRPGSAGTAEPRPSAAGPAPDPGQPPDDREPDRDPGGGPTAGQPTAEATAGAPTGAHPTAPYAYPPSGPYAFPPPEQYAYPPPGPFGGPPPGEQGGWGPYAYPPPAQYGEPPAPGRRSRRCRTVIALLVAAVLLVAAAGAGVFYYERSTRTVALLAADVPGDDPFTPTLVQSGSLIPTARFDATANRTPTGELDGLYLDSTGSSGCNRAQLESTLRGDPALATAWAAPLGVNAMQAPVYVAAGLTPVRLRADTRLTAHGNSGGRARPYAATLQAGTAVLVDDRVYLACAAQTGRRSPAPCRWRTRSTAAGGTGSTRRRRSRSGPREPRSSSSGSSTPQAPSRSAARQAPRVRRTSWPSRTPAGSTAPTS